MKKFAYFSFGVLSYAAGVSILIFVAHDLHVFNQDGGLCR